MLIQRDTNKIKIANSSKKKKHTSEMKRMNILLANIYLKQRQK